MDGGSGPPNVSVVICTWNRADLLRRTLAEMTKLVVPDRCEWEVLIVDNGSTDTTPRVVSAFREALPLRSVHEPVLGLSHARNRALEEVTGELILWTDDDVLVDEDWVAAYVAAARDFPEAPFFGGTVDPWFEEPPPRWIEDNIAEFVGAFAIRQLDDAVRRFEASELPFGANMAMRRAAVSGMRFDPELGRSGSEMLSGEETEFLRRVRVASGQMGVWVGEARVRHWIPSERLTREYLRRFYMGLGEAAGQAPQPRERRLGRVPLWVLRGYLEASAKTILRGGIKDDRWARSFRRSAYLRGFIEARRRGD